MSKKNLLGCLLGWFIYTLFFNISVRDKAVSGEGLLPVPPQFPCLISTQEESDEIPPYLSLSQCEDSGVYNGLQHKQEVYCKVDTEYGVWMDVSVGVETA